MNKTIYRLVDDPTYRELKDVDADNIHFASTATFEREGAADLMRLLYPCLKRNKNKRFVTSEGDKTAMGMYRTLRRFFHERP